MGRFDRSRDAEGHQVHIQNGRGEDEDIVQRLRGSLTTANPLPADLNSGVFAAHVVAAATTSARTNGANTGLLFQRMIELLNGMSDGNPTFGPSRVRSGGNLVRDRAYVRFDPESEEAPLVSKKGA